MARCVRVPKRSAETVRRELEEKSQLSFSHRLQSDGDFILIPVTDDYEGETVDAGLRPRTERPSDYRDVIDVPPELRQHLPSSFDVVGDIIIIKIPDELVPVRKKMGEALLSVYPNIRAVFSDDGVKGEFRIRDLTRIAGTGTARTLHKENGTQITTDPSKVYFNPRLSQERARVASLVRKGEVIIDMFGGVAPFGCVICRNASPSKVYSIDLNPACEPFALENARINRIKVLEPITGDAVKVIRTLPDADRIVMNLPQMADEFLPDALAHIKPSGTVHMHMILTKDTLDEYCRSLSDRMAGLGTPIRVASVRELKNYSPTQCVYVLDIRPRRPPVRRIL